jgi:hypothetical protein
MMDVLEDSWAGRSSGNGGSGGGGGQAAVGGDSGSGGAAADTGGSGGGGPRFPDFGELELDSHRDVAAALGCSEERVLQHAGLARRGGAG